jgi:hypothetical protein
MNWAAASSSRARPLRWDDDVVMVGRPPVFKKRNGNSGYAKARYGTATPLVKSATLTAWQ